MVQKYSFFEKIQLCQKLDMRYDLNRKFNSKNNGVRIF